jgi:hypothetical protein
LQAINWVRARGNATSPLQVQANDMIATQAFQVYTNDTGGPALNMGFWDVFVKSTDGNGVIGLTSRETAFYSNISDKILEFGNIYLNGNVNFANQAYVYNNGYIQGTSINATTANIGTGNVDIYANGYIDTVGRLSYLRTYGSFTSNATQTSAGANSTNYMTLNNTEEANGVSIASNSQITVARTGVYDIQFSAVFTHDTNQIANVEVWLNKNGNAIANTNTIITITKDQKSVAAWDWLVNANSANDYYQIAWASADTNVEIVAVDAANTIANVAVPSVIVTVTPVGA